MTKRNNFYFYCDIKILMLVLMISLLGISMYAAAGGNYEISRSQIGGISNNNNLSNGDITLQRAFSQPVLVGVKSQNGFYLISGYLYLTTDNPRVIAFSPSAGSYALSVSTVIKVYFENDINATNLSNAIKVYEWKNNTASIVNKTSSIKTIYSPTDNSVTIFPESGYFKSNYTYVVVISSGITEPEEGLALEDELRWGFTTLAHKTLPNVFEYDYNPLFKIEVPPDVIPADDYFIIMSTDPKTSSINVLPEDIEVANTKALKQDESRRISEYYEIAAIDGKLNNIDTLSGIVNVTLPFQSIKKFQAPLKSYPNLKFKRRFNLYYLDKEKKLWIKVPGVTVDTSEGIIKGALPYLGTFSVIADPDYDLTTAYAFPVPYSPNENPNHKNIIFADLATRCSIKIFTITGELVREIDYDANTSSKPYYEWDVKNKDGIDVASGVYLYLIESPKDRKLGKLMIIR